MALNPSLISFYGWKGYEGQFPHRTKTLLHFSIKIQSFFINKIFLLRIPVFPYFGAMPLSVLSGT